MTRISHLAMKLSRAQLTIGTSKPRSIGFEHGRKLPKLLPPVTFVRALQQHHPSSHIEQTASRGLHNHACGPLRSPYNPTSHDVHPTLELIRTRYFDGSAPRQRNDPYKLGLVVEGGGMRGIVSGAMLIALAQLGLRNVFDVVYGASAGAINATYFLSSQDHGLDIYTEDLTSHHFLDLSAMLPSPARMLRGGESSNPPSRPAMDLSYLIDHVMRQVKPLDWDAVINSPIHFKVVASSLDAMRPIILQDFKCDRDLADCLHASAMVPEVAGPPRLVRGHRCLDAAVFEPVPVGSALRDGCTHVLVLRTKSAPRSQTMASLSNAARSTGAAATAAAMATRMDSSQAGASAAESTATLAAAPLSFLSYPRAATSWMKRRAMRVVTTAVWRALLLKSGCAAQLWSSGHSDHSHVDHELVMQEALHACPHAVREQVGGYVLPVFPVGASGVHPFCKDVGRLRTAQEEGFAAVRTLMAPVLGLRE